jgi:hypothetical protein
MPKYSEEQLRLAKIPYQMRDYCSDYYIDYLKCVRANGPLKHGVKCKHEAHDWHLCQNAE